MLASLSARQVFDFAGFGGAIVGILSLYSRQQPFDGAMSGLKLRDAGIVPVICPTCQNVFACKASMPAIPSYFAWGCFRYFG
jgi:hypothetical protein